MTASATIWLRTSMPTATPERAVGGAGEDAADRRLEDGGAPRRHAGRVRVDPGQGDRHLYGDAGGGDDRAEPEVRGELGGEDAPARRCGEERRDGGAVTELPGGADGAEGDEQEQEVAAGAEDVAYAGGVSMPAAVSLSERLVLRAVKARIAARKP